MLSVNTNISSLNAKRSLLSNSQGAAVAMERLASGKRINSAKDDAAGLAIASRLESQVKGVTQGIRNLSDATSVLQVAEGGMASIETNLQRIRELAVQAANGSYSDADRSSLNNEATQLLAEIDRVASSTSFGGQSLLDGTFTNKNFNLGNAGEDLTVSIGASDSLSLGIHETATVALGSSGSISDSALAARVRVSNDVNGEHAVAWETLRASSNKGIPDEVNMQRFDSSGVEKNSQYSDGTGITHFSPEVTVLANGSTVTIYNDKASTNDEFDSKLEVYIHDSSGNLTTNYTIDHAWPNDGNNQSALHLASVVDLGNSRFMVAYTHAHRGNPPEANGASAEVYDYSGNLVKAQFSIISDSSAEEVWAEEVVYLGNDLIAAPILDRSNGTTTQMSIKIMNWSTGSQVANVSLDSVSSLTHPETYYVYTTDDADTSASLRLVAGEQSLGAFWMNADTSKLYGQIFDFSGTALTSKLELAGDADYLNAIHNSVSGKDYFDVLYGENSTGTEKTLFQRFDASLNPLISEAALIFDGKSAQAELVKLGNGSLRAYETYNKSDPVGYQDFTVTHFSGGDLTTLANATSTISKVDIALSNLNTNRSEVGAQMNRIESAISTLQSTKENSATAKSRIVDADYAAETARLAKHQILQQASISVLAQANARPEMVLALLRGL